MKLPVRVELAPAVWLRLATEAHRRNLHFPGYVTMLLGAEADRIRDVRYVHLVDLERGQSGIAIGGKCGNQASRCNSHSRKVA
jgi:hypothetical protein